MPIEPDASQSETEQKHPDGSSPPGSPSSASESTAANAEQAGTPHPSAKSQPNRSSVAPETVEDRQALMHLASAGFELASFSLILGGAGYAIDHWLGNGTPYLGIAGLFVGFSLGFYRLIVLAGKMN
ncbi:AtpZ/AtpI family protein [Aporhodopirellula aestuarii]|uniref:AtpZ/AtpI family protein n=1 Tax=Aporhodopirellula aestuarii TaxID=2950107 RepID=A0ABT0UAD3_9BACT|nr:AtpZ/AtpI family protein [Aporhodopirellula aestuarii]MCM2373772.1 AtpZ/AtpI family protein [Aporhodopirellula aestuarii]